MNRPTDEEIEDFLKDFSALCRRRGIIMEPYSLTGTVFRVMSEAERGPDFKYCRETDTWTNGKG